MRQFWQVILLFFIFNAIISRYLLFPTLVLAQSALPNSISINEIPLDTLELKKQEIPKLPTRKLQASLNQTEPDLGQLNYVLSSGDPKEKLDILFIPQRIQNIASVSALIQQMFYVDDTTSNDSDGLFLRPPFNQYQTKFNISYVDQNIDETYFNCWLEEPNPNGPPQWSLAHGCDNELIKLKYAKYNPDYIVVLFKLPVGYHSTGGDLMYLESDVGLASGSEEMKNYIAWLFTHEFAHQFGGLADEYTTGPGAVANYCGYAQDSSCFANYEKGISAVPNLDKVGCPKWCQSYSLTALQQENSVCAQFTNQTDCLNPETTSCSWFNIPHPYLRTKCVTSQSWVGIGAQCSLQTECVYGADYGQLAFKPDIASVMNGGQYFNGPSIDHLNKALSCCYPRSDSTECQAFRSKFENIPQETNYYLRTALERIAYCPANCEINMQNIFKYIYNKILCANVDLNSDQTINSIDFAIYTHSRFLLSR